MILRPIGSHHPSLLPQISIVMPPPFPPHFWFFLFQTDPRSGSFTPPSSYLSNSLSPQDSLPPNSPCSPTMVLKAPLFPLSNKPPNRRLYQIQAPIHLPERPGILCNWETWALWKGYPMGWGLRGESGESIISKVGNQLLPRNWRFSVVRSFSFFKRKQTMLYMKSP